MPSSNDVVFAGSVPELYEALMVPLFFEPFAQETARRAAALRPLRVLEVAAGTGAVTRALAAALPVEVEIVATDLNPPMLAKAQSLGTSRPVSWQPADAMALPFADESFDLVVCQFGAMFFPDKPQAYAEARRVLRRGGTYLCAVWGSIEHNDFAREVDQTLLRLFPDNPSNFIARTPHGYFERDRIERDLRDGGFRDAPSFETVVLPISAPSPQQAAAAICQGTPTRNEIEEREPGGLVRVTEVCAQAIAQAYGTSVVHGKAQAHVIAAKKH